MPTLQHWLVAFRLRTLPLALASICMGSFLAYSNGHYRPAISLWAALTTIFLQVLSNLANDYGDSVHGADSEARKGPARMVQSGAISKGTMKKAMYFFVALSLFSGLYLLYNAFIPQNTSLFYLFLAIGILAITAAITYTAGKKPYGYAGLGDMSVMIFFGWIGVIGTYFLHTLSFEPTVFLPASSCGFFAVAVLNLNNIRDIQSDKAAGKLSIPVRIGRKNAVLYHWTLLLGGLLCAICYVLVHQQALYQYLFMAVFPLLLINARAVSKYTEPALLDPYLKQMALTTLLFVLLFGVGQILPNQ